MNQNYSQKVSRLLLCLAAGVGVLPGKTNGSAAAAPVDPGPRLALPAEFTLPEAAGWTPGRLPEATAERLDKALDQARERIEATALSAALLVPHAGLWQQPAENEAPVRYWASVGKAVTAALILQLDAEGRLRLNDRLKAHLPKAPFGRSITLHQLLHHTSGLPLNRPARGKTELLFSPGKGWSYSNFGYQLLGEVIEQATDMNYAEAVAARLATPLDLKTFRALDPEASPPGSPAGMDSGPDAPGAAGNIVASAPEMLRFWHALLSGKLLPAPQMAILTRGWQPTPDQKLWFGSGLMIYALPSANGSPRFWIGHSGGTPHVQAAVAWSNEKQALAAVALEGQGSAESILNLFFQAL